MLELDSVIPVVSITRLPDMTVITGIEGSDICHFAFQVDQTFVEYRVKAVPSIDARESFGAQIDSASGSVNMQGVNLDGYAPNTEIPCLMKGLDLQSASVNDGDKIVKVFARTSVGNWSVA
jgi:hypothetical protein